MICDDFKIISKTNGLGKSVRAEYLKGRCLIFEFCAFLNSNKTFWFLSGVSFLKNFFNAKITVENKRL